MTRAIARRVRKLESRAAVGLRHFWMLSVPEGMGLDDAMQGLGIEAGRGDLIMQAVTLGDETEPAIMTEYDLR